MVFDGGIGSVSGRGDQESLWQLAPMNKITSRSSYEEIAVLVSEALERAGVDAVLGGGGAVSQYSNNEYESADI